MKTPKKWCLWRHKLIFTLLRPVIAPYVRLRYGVKVERFRDQGKRAYLIAMNHQTAYDQFLVAMSFRDPVYFIASDDLFSNGWIAKLLRFIVAPIPIKKQVTDIQAVKTCIKVAREGGTIALAPEGNRTYDGRPVNINPAIGGLAKKLGLPLALYRIEGGYGVHPRWSDVVRKGPMRAYVSRVVEPEELAALSANEVYELLCRELYVDDTKIEGEYPHPKNAEYLERAIYVCPKCGLSTFESHGDTIECKCCGLKVRHRADKRLEGIGEEFPFRFVADWYDYQRDFVTGLDLSAYHEQPAYEDLADIWNVIVCDHKELLERDAAVKLYGDRITVGSRTFNFTEISTLTVLGRNKLNIYHGKDLYQLKSGKRFNALKYVNFYYRWKQTGSEDTNGKFLGL